MICRRIWPIAAAVALMEGGAVAQVDLPEGGGSMRGQLPFSTTPDRLPGPPRVMGELPAGETQPPSDLPGGSFAQPPRAMGETPPTSPFFPFFPSTTTRPGLPPLLSPYGAIGGRPGANRALPLFLPEAAGEVAQPGLPPAIEPGEVDRPAPERAPPAGPALALEEVLASSERNYPPFLSVLQERRLGDGDVLSARGSFDLFFNTDARNYPLGFYDRYVWDVFVEQPLFNNGGEVFAGYRLAQGQWPVYYNYLNTRGGGAFVAGLKFALLKNRAIDARRAKLLQSEIERRKVEPTILKERVTLFKNASKVYWEWVAAGRAYRVSEDLVRTVEARYRGLERQVPTFIREIDLESARLSVLSRQQQLVVARLRFQQASIELSLFLRDRYCFPILADQDRLPAEFPAVPPPDGARMAEDIDVALRLRPEILALRLQAQKAVVEREYAVNQLQPSLSLYLYSEQNVGVRDKDLGGDFRPFILESSLLFDVPLQRRFARGRVIAADASLRQIALQTRFAVDRIRADVQQALTAVDAAYEQLRRYREYVERTRRLEDAERRLFQRGLSTILNVFIREQATADAEILRIDAEAKYLSAVADYRAALGLDAVPGDVR